MKPRDRKRLRAWLDSRPKRPFKRIIRSLQRFLAWLRAKIVNITKKGN